MLFVLADADLVLNGSPGAKKYLESMLDMSVLTHQKELNCDLGEKSCVRPI